MLTGSANLMDMPKVADSLAGRMETLALLPLSQSEIVLQTTIWIDNTFNQRILQAEQISVWDELIDRVLKVGYTEAVTRESYRRRAKVSQQCIDPIIQRDVRDIATIDKLDQLLRCLSALCQTEGQICNHSKLGGKIDIDGKTMSRYISILSKYIY